MKTPEFQERPTHIPTTQANGSLLKPITQVILDRRATPHFKPDPVPTELLDAILRFAAQAPSGYNLQPWRFVIVTEPERRQKLRKAAMDQEKVSEAPVVVIAFAERRGWRIHLDAIFREGVRRGAASEAGVEKAKKSAVEFISGMSEPLWLNRHTMIAVTTMMLMAEACGLDTAPMEGFDAEAVRTEFGLPSEAEVVALLAIGFADGPDKPYGGRLALEEIVHREHYGQPWKTNGDV